MEFDDKLTEAVNEFLTLVKTHYFYCYNLLILNFIFNENDENIYNKFKITIQNLPDGLFYKDNNGINDIEFLILEELDRHQYLPNKTKKNILKAFGISKLLKNNDENDEMTLISDSICQNFNRINEKRETLEEVKAQLI